VRWIDEVLDIALERPLQPLPAKPVEAMAAKAPKPPRKGSAETRAH
jgi:ATP-dependent Lon protease